MPTNLEIYEALKKHLHEEAARVIAEALPATDTIATKSDILMLKAETEALIRRLEAATYRWMLTFFATLFLGMGGMIVAIVLKG